MSVSGRLKKERRSVRARGARISRRSRGGAWIRVTKRKPRAGFAREKREDGSESARDAPVMVTVVVLDCPCGPAWGPDCCMSNAVGMMREGSRRLDAIPRGCPEMRGGHAPRRRARRQRAKSAVRTRGHALPSECARRAAVSGSAFLGLAPCSGAGRFARNRAGLEEKRGRKEARESGFRASAHRFLFGRSRSVRAKLASSARKFRNARRRCRVVP